MFLSKIELDIRHPSVRQALRDVNDMHRNLMAGFPDRDDLSGTRASLGVLYRLVSNRNEACLLVLSETEPDTSKLAQRGLMVVPTAVRDISLLKDRLVKGMCLRFELLASPCKKVKGSDGNSRRHYLETEQERAGWLRRKAEEYGFELLSLVEISGRIDMVGRREGNVIKNSGILFAGVLRITDADRFWQGYTHGIGPGKAYGLGMLSIARI